MAANEKEAWQAQSARFALMSEVVLLIAKSSDLDGLLKGAINKVKWVIDFERCTLALVNSGGASYSLRTLMESRRDVPHVDQDEVPLADGFPGRVIATRQVLLIQDLSAFEDMPSFVDPALEDGTVASLLSLPLSAYDKTLGAMTFTTTRANGYSDDDIKAAVSFVSHLSLAIDRWQKAQELKEAHEALRAAKEQAELATQTKSQFLANMSHELRTPLNAVIGLTEMLHEDAEDLGQDDFLEPLDRIKRAGKHLLHLINDVLDLSKIEAGRLEFHMEDFEVATMVRDAANTSQTLAQQNSNELVVNCPDDIGAMRSDLTRVRQILLNLLSNACKFTKSGTVTFGAVKQTGASGDEIVFTVADTGIGLTQEQIAKLFQEFVQADASTTRKYGGTGLGLAISKRLANTLGGDISVESVPGEGTTFTVRLPEKSESVGPEAGAGEQTKVVPMEVPAPPVAEDSAAANTVLVVDDDATARDLMRRFLAKEGFDVVTATDGEECLRLARDVHPAVIMLDVLMPGLDGWDVLRELKADAELAHIPVTMITIMDEQSKGFSLGAADYMTKPIDRDRLRALLQKYRTGGAEQHVLVVDDESDTREMLRRALEAEGWKVTDAENGRIGLEKLAETRPALILLDLMMPEMDGFQFLTELRKSADLSSIPVVVVTSADLTEDDRAQLSGGVEHILEKAAHSKDDLLAEIAKLAERYAGKPKVDRAGHGDD